MLVCGSCGEDNPDRARFCLACGAALDVQPDKREVRKQVTLVFTDLAGSTALGERLDPETLRRMLARYFAAMSSILERHGGTVEKYVGDAILAVFGIPQLHEDDALRAVRAAVEMRDAMAELNAHFEEEVGVGLAVRTGVNTGEVVAGDPGSGQAFVSGDAVNVAARLEQHSGPGEILIGPDTYRLVRNAVEVEPVAPLELKGKSQLFTPYRLLRVAPDTPGLTRRLHSALIGRDHEIGLLRQGFERAQAERACHLFTILGPAGVGKSRLVSDFLDGLPDDVTVTRGHCLPYGDGITYWPLAEAIRNLIGAPEGTSREDAAIGISERLSEQPDGTVTGMLLQMLGLAPVVGGVDELSWAARRLFEQIARTGPLVVLIDDIHWAEPALLDTIEYIADWARSSPILLICLARPELLDARPNWGGGKVNATSLLLEPLGGDASRALVHELLGAADLPPVIEKKISEVAEGNPLYVEQMLEMLIDDGFLIEDDDAWRATALVDELVVPPTIMALLGARLDRLQAEERAAIERASVIGRVFYSGALRELTPSGFRNNLRHNLQALVRKELVHPDEDDLFGEDGYRFGHILIRDAAYEGLPKEQRAQLHKAFGDWLEARAGAAGRDLEDIIAHHLAEAYRYRVELGQLTEEARALAERAAELSHASGRRAMDRGDSSAASTLLSRTLDLMPDDRMDRFDAMLDLAEAEAQLGQFKRAKDLLQDVAAHDADEVRRSCAELMLVNMQLFAEPGEALLDRARRQARKSIDLATERVDHRILARAWMTLQLVDVVEARMGPAIEYGSRALTHAIASGSRLLQGEIAAWLFEGYVYGPSPVDEALAGIEDVLRQGGGQLAVAAGAALAEGALITFRGDIESGRELMRSGREMYRQLGNNVMWAGLGIAEAQSEALNGNHEAAVALLRPACEELDRLGEKSVFSTAVGMLAEYLCSLGAYDEAEVCAGKARDAGAVEDATTQTMWRATFARIAASRADHEDALRWVRELRQWAEGMDQLPILGHLHESIAEAMDRLGRNAEASAALETAREMYAAKGVTVRVALLDERLSASTQTM